MGKLSSQLATQTLVPHSKLYVSTPNPIWFGNGPNQSNNRSWTDKNWLKSRFHFSFAEYSSHHNSNFGVIRVLNDDLVQPNRGFGEHPHRNMEIITYVVDGALTHQDSMGTSETLGRGSIQFMTAGSGVSHSERNNSKTNPLRFIQTWVTPRASNLEPVYGSTRGEAKDRINKWAHLCSDVSNPKADTPVKVHQDVDLFVSELDSNKTLELNVGPGRQAYLVCLEGSLSLTQSDSSSTNKQSKLLSMTTHDACELVHEQSLEVQAGESGCHVLVYHMAYDPSAAGRTDLH